MVAPTTIAAARSGVAELFRECLASVGKPVHTLTKKDRMKIIRLLNQKNAFSYRRSVPFVAKHLQVSRYTIYKYLDELSREDTQEGETP